MLNAQFVNTWVLLRELPELINGAKGEGAGRVAERLQAHYTDSVDILALTPEAEVLMHQPEMALIKLPFPKPHPLGWGCRKPNADLTKKSVSVTIFFTVWQ